MTISEPLPNGYSLQALSKMPDFAQISTGDIEDGVSSPSVQLSQCVGSIAVSGPFVAGQYSHPFADFYPNPTEPWFLVDTRTGSHSDFASKSALEQQLGHEVQPVSVIAFHSEEPWYLAQQRRNRRIMFIPPTIALIAFFALVLQARRAATS